MRKVRIMVELRLFTKDCVTHLQGFNWGCKIINCSIINQHCKAERFSTVTLLVIRDHRCSVPWIRVLYFQRICITTNLPLLPQPCLCAQITSCATRIRCSQIIWVAVCSTLCCPVTWSHCRQHRLSGRQ